MKDLAWLVYLYPARWMARILPIPLLYALGDAAAALSPLCLRGPRRRLLERLSLGLQANTADRRLADLANRYFRNAILRFLDDLLLERLLCAGRLDRVEVIGLPNLTEALSEGKGALLIGGHFFASRVGRRYLAGIGYPCLSVRNRKPPDCWAGRLGLRWLQKRYMAFLSELVRDEVAIQAPDCTLQMLARLRAGGLVGCLLDASFSREVVHREFLGQEKRFPVGFLYVAKVAGCPLVPVHYSGNSRGLKIKFGQPVRLETLPERKDFVDCNVSTVVRILEEQIRSDPAEWELWIRW